MLQFLRRSQHGRSCLTRLSSQWLPHGPVEVAAEMVSLKEPRFLGGLVRALPPILCVIVGISLTLSQS